MITNKRVFKDELVRTKVDFHLMDSIIDMPYEVLEEFITLYFRKKYDFTLVNKDVDVWNVEKNYRAILDNDEFEELFDFINYNLKFYIHEDETGFQYYVIKTKGEFIKYPVEYVEDKNNEN